MTVWVLVALLANNVRGKQPVIEVDTMVFAKAIQCEMAKQRTFKVLKSQYEQTMFVCKQRKVITE